MAHIQIANIISEPALQFLLTNAEDNLDMKRGALANVFTYSNLVHAIAGAVVYFISYFICLFIIFRCNIAFIYSK
jgi:hypothetical protein